MEAGSEGTRARAAGPSLRLLARALFYIALPLALITTSVRVAFSEQRVYSYAIDHYDAATRTGIDHDDLIAATHDLRAYFTNDEQFLRTRVHDADGNVAPLYNTKEILHMRDVKRLVRVVYGLQELSLAFLALYIAGVVLWAREESLAALARRALTGSAATVGLLILFGAVAATGGFDAAFIKFHQIAFPGNSDWQLDPLHDHLIQMFPEGFWRDATILIVLLILAQAALIAGGAWLYLRRQRPQPALSTVAPPGAVEETTAAEPTEEIAHPVA
ncbi:MAG TPA: TIGR01906 family membrane protein [Dehalococcoidia bacterium]|nr:TIGR01906 family membrane protein [Dehalococcoidia bacterium]